MFTIRAFKGEVKNEADPPRVQTVDIEIRNSGYAQQIVQSLVHEGFEVTVKEVREEVKAGDPDIALLQRLQRASEKMTQARANPYATDCSGGESR